MLALDSLVLFIYASLAAHVVPLIIWACIFLIVPPTLHCGIRHSLAVHTETHTLQVIIHIEICNMLVIDE